MNQPAGFMHHNKRINTHCGFGIDRIQNVIHLRDNTDPTIDYYGRVHSFYVGSHCIEISTTLAGPVAPPWGGSFDDAALNNAATVFHEIGHAFSLVHTAGNTGAGNEVLLTTAVHPDNNTDITGNTSNDGVIWVSSTTFQHPDGRIFARAYYFSEGNKLMINGNAATVTHIMPAPLLDENGRYREVGLVIEGDPVPLGANIQVRGQMYYPEIMDWTVYESVPNGPELQINNELDGPQYTVGEMDEVIHKDEVRVRTIP